MRTISGDPGLAHASRSPLAAISDAAGPDGSFQGEWRTSLSIVKLEQKGNAVTGTYGNAGQFPLKGTVKDNVLTFEYTKARPRARAATCSMSRATRSRAPFRSRTAGAGNGTAGGPTPKPPPASWRRSAGSG